MPGFHIFALFTLGYFLSFFFRSANAVIASDLSRDLSLTAGQLGFITSLFFITAAAIQLPLGSALDRFGPRWVTSSMMLLAALGSLVFALAPSFVVLALGRALIGLGMAGVMIGGLKAFVAWFPAGRYATVAGLMMGLGASGGLVAATPLAWLNEMFGWRVVFAWGALVIVLLASAIVLFSRNAPPGVSWRPSGQPSGGFGEVFRDLKFWRIALSMFFLTGTLMAVQGLWAGPYLFDVIGLSNIAAGNVLLFLAAGGAFGFATSGLVADRFGLPQVIMSSGLLFLVSQVALAFMAFGLWRLPLGLTYLVFGLAGAFSMLLLSHARRVFPTSITGRVLSAVNLFGIGGSGLLQWWLGLVLGAFPLTGEGTPPKVAYGTAFMLTAVAGLAALLWYLPLLRGAGVVEENSVVE